MKHVRDIVEDTLIRLEEFQSIVRMVSENPDRIQAIYYLSYLILIYILNILFCKVENGSAECIQQHLPKLQYIKDGMTSLCKRIDALEHVVAMANMNLSSLETAVDKAEAELGVSDRLFGILNPLSFFVSITWRIFLFV